MTKNNMMRDWGLFQQPFELSSARQFPVYILNNASYGTLTPRHHWITDSTSSLPNPDFLSATNIKNTLASEQ
tara:strand:- start:1383 stop:1598 length:216 start_codon:yes stop_codon:yes gene_type:complete